MYRISEKTGGERPIDLIRQTSPILISGRAAEWTAASTARAKSTRAHVAL